MDWKREGRHVLSHGDKLEYSGVQDGTRHVSKAAAACLHVHGQSSPSNGAHVPGDASENSTRSRWVGPKDETDWSGVCRLRPIENEENVPLEVQRPAGHTSSRLNPDLSEPVRSGCRRFGRMLRCERTMEGPERTKSVLRVLHRQGEWLCCCWHHGKEERGVAAPQSIHCDAGTRNRQARQRLRVRRRRRIQLKCVLL